MSAPIPQTPFPLLLQDDTMSRSITFIALLLSGCAALSPLPQGGDSPSFSIFPSTAVDFDPPETAKSLVIRNIANIAVGRTEGGPPTSISRDEDGTYVLTGTAGDSADHPAAYALALAADGTKKW